MRDGLSLFRQPKKERTNWTKGLDKAKVLAKAIKEIKKQVKKRTGRILPIGDITGALGKYEAYKEAVAKLGMNGALWQARNFGEMYKDCLEFPEKVSRWHEAVDDWGRPYKKEWE